MTQSVLDLGKFGTVGDVLFANSATKFYLYSQDYDKAKEEKWLDVHPFIFDIVKSLKTPRPRYSEIFISSPIGQGVARLVLNPFLYYLFTSDKVENNALNELVRAGMTYAQAIEEIVRRTTPVKQSFIENSEDIKECRNY